MADVLARVDPMFSERDATTMTTTTTSNRSSRHASGMSSPVMSKAQVVYYLSRGGKMEPPHMIEVPHSPYDGLRLKDVKQRLIVLRGGGMPNLFSWSCKRMYKNTHIWQDVCDEDTLTPVSGGEYVLKGSEYFESNQDRSSARNPELLQRKFRGAETWLKASAAGTPAQSSSRDHNSQPPVHHAYERPPDNYSMVNHLKNLSMDAAAAVKRPVMEAGVEYNVKVPNGGTLSEESGMHDIGVCEVRSRAAGAHSDHGCNVGPQAEDMRYSYGTSSQDYSKSGSSTPNCNGNAGDRNQALYHQQQQHQQQRLATNVEGTMPVGKASKPRKSKGSRLSRRFSHSQGKESGPNVKMKQSAASCVFLHILSYCGGVETKAQRSSPPTEVASSEYSFDGLCSAESKLPSQTRSPHYSMELHKEQLAYQAGEVNRSGPLIPYSSEYFDVKETVTPPPASPLQPGKASKAASSFQETEEMEEDEEEEEAEAEAEVGRPSDADSVGPRPLLGGQDDETLTRAGSSRGLAAAAATLDDRSSMRPWNSKLRLSKRKFLRHWWQVLLQGLQAKTFTGRLRPAERRSTSTRRFFVGSRSRSRRVRRRQA